MEDDGRGFDGAALGPEALGLLGMTERATALGGTVQFAERDGGNQPLEANPGVCADSRARSQIIEDLHP